MCWGLFGEKRLPNRFYKGSGKNGPQNRINEEMRRRGLGVSVERSRRLSVGHRKRGTEESYRFYESVFPCQVVTGNEWQYLHTATTFFLTD